MICTDYFKGTILQSSDQCIYIFLRTKRRVHLIVWIITFNIIGSEDKMMRANLCCDIVQSLFLHNLHHLRNTFCGTMAQMQSCPCLSGKKNISRCDHILNCIADTWQTKSPRILILIHTSITAQINILTVSKNRNIEFLCHFHSFFAKPGIHNRFAVFR